MLKFVDTQVTFAEVPDEISLCINISQCPHHCKGCHSPYLQEDTGNELNKGVLSNLIKVNNGITCVCFMGGDNDIPQLCDLAKYAKDVYKLKVAWYTGLEWNPQNIVRPITLIFDFIKTGKYVEQFGPLTSPTTNQRFFTKGIHIKKMDANPNSFYDTTDRFWNDENRA